MNEEAEIILSIKDEILMTYGEAASKKQCVNFFAAKYRVPKKDIVKMLFDEKVLDALAIGKYISSGMLPEMSKEEIHAHAKPRISREEDARRCGFSGVEKKSKPEPKASDTARKTDAIQDALIVAATKYLEMHDNEYKQYAEVVHTCENLLHFIGGVE